MTISVEIYRGAGERRGDDVIDPLIGSMACAIARGRAEMDARAHQRSRVTLQIPHRPGLRLGQLVQIADAAGVWVGRIIGIHHQADPVKIMTQLVIDKPYV
ncbi:MAG: hypothetical protein HQM04_06510 [Magnetococcales bacterium]|nr:hypothetical protein [Magnetococcales bacterium]MBF0114679.1 hypothetical protein [Magnetococcales bacterium]